VHIYQRIRTWSGAQRGQVILIAHKTRYSECMGSMDTLAPTLSPPIPWRSVLSRSLRLYARLAAREAESARYSRPPAFSLSLSSASFHWLTYESLASYFIHLLASNISRIYHNSASWRISLSITIHETVSVYRLPVSGDVSAFEHRVIRQLDVTKTESRLMVAMVLLLLVEIE